jgi:hypothetical protein
MFLTVKPNTLYSARHACRLGMLITPTVRGRTIGSFKVATYLILIFYLTGFYCQIKISNLIGVFKVAIYSYLINYLL